MLTFIPKNEKVSYHTFLDERSGMLQGKKHQFGSPHKWSVSLLSVTSKLPDYVCTANGCAALGFGLVSKITWLVDKLNKMSLALVFFDFMKYQIIYKSVLLAMKGDDKIIKRKKGS